MARRERAGLSPDDVRATPAIRTARHADVGALTSIRRDAILQLAVSTYGRERTLEWANSSARERVERALNQNEVWVAELGHGAAGWVEVAGNRVEGIYVRPDASGTGVGSALLQHAEDRIRSNGHRVAELDASLNAEGFYLRRGYTTRPGRPADQGIPMRKQLPAQEG